LVGVPPSLIVSSPASVNGDTLFDVDQYVSGLVSEVSVTDAEVTAKLGGAPLRHRVRECFATTHRRRYAGVVHQGVNSISRPRVIRNWRTPVACQTALAIAPAVP
jgi:hypothetical protein